MLVDTKAIKVLLRRLQFNFSNQSLITTSMIVLFYNPSTKYDIIYEKHMVSLFYNRND